MLSQQIIANSYPVNISITSSDAAGSASIAISAHTRRYTDKDVAITAKALTGLMSNTSYFLYYDDAARAGGNVAIAATTDYPSAFNAVGQPGRHYVGSIVTPVTGGGQTGGGGGTPPGGSGGNNVRQPANVNQQ